MPSIRFRTLKELDATEGTVQLLESTVRHQHVGKSAIILVPQPSQDPNDPLRWSRRKKHMAFAGVCFFAFANNFTIDGPSAAFVNIAKSYDTTLNRASGLLSWVILVLGLSNFFWIPTASYFGKRPTLILAISIEIAATIWSARAKSFNSLLASSIVAAFGGGASEALAAAVINDLYFLHERGRRFGYYIVSIAWGSAVGPLCGGFIIQNVGLPWQKWTSLIVLAINLLWFLLFLPETRFHRDTSAAAVVGRNVASNAEDSPAETLGEQRKEKLDSEQAISRENSIRRTRFQERSLWSGVNTETSYLSLLLRPLPLIIYPACTFAVLAYSISLAPTVVIAILSSPILASPPYNFGVGVVGLINVSVMVGHLVGAIGGGWATDKWVEFRAAKNNGVFQPESRLTLILPLATCVFIGTLMFGFAAGDQMSWPVLYVAYGFVSVGLTGIPSITMTYAVESYYPVSAECLEVINGLKNVITFGVIYATVPWAESQGYKKEFGEVSALFVGVIGLAIPLSLYGLKIRHYTSSKWRLISW